MREGSRKFLPSKFGPVVVVVSGGGGGGGDYVCVENLQIVTIEVMMSQSIFIKYTLLCTKDGLFRAGNFIPCAVCLPSPPLQPRGKGQGRRRLNCTVGG